MSAKVMGLVWDQQMERGMKFVLLAYADHADHDGGNIFPAIDKIVKKTGYDERSVQRITSDLERAGYLVLDGNRKGGVGKLTHWHIPIKDDKIAPIPKGDKIDNQRVTKSTERVTKHAVKGDKTRTERVTPVSPDPSLTVREPSEEEKGNPPPPVFSFPTTPLEASKHPDIKVFHNVSKVFPGQGDYAVVIDAVRLLRKTHPVEQELESYLLPFWLAWASRKKKDGNPFSKTNPTWLTEWAINNHVPDFRENGKPPDGQTYPALQGMTPA